MDSTRLEGCDFRDVQIDSQTSFVGANVKNAIAYKYQRRHFKLSGMTEEQLNSMKWEDNSFEE